MPEQVNLFAIIGQKQVQIELLQAQVQELQKQIKELKDASGSN
jgi:hypothetical protein